MDDWVPGAIIYQVNLRSLAAREPRNAFEALRETCLHLSPLAYVSQNLELIRRLGATVIYLMPPYPIGRTDRKGIGSPYASRNFKSVDREYGAIDELGGLVQKAHELGLKIILDITPNHTSRDHVWTESNPEFYVHGDDGELYYDFDWSDTAKLNYQEPGLRVAMLDVLNFWLSLLGSDGVDGFRFDMAHMINDPGFWDEALAGLRRRYSGRRLLFLAECYGTENNLALFGRGMDAGYDDDFYKVCQYLYAVNEKEKSVVALSAEAEGNRDFADKLAAYRAGGIAGAMLRAILNYEEATAANAHWLARYTDNHDEGRGCFRFGDGAVRAVNRLIFLLPSTLPFLLTGQEFGAMNRPSIHARIGVCDKGRRVTVHGERRESGVEFEGNLFARGIDARGEWYMFYRKLIDLRLAYPALTKGGFSPVDVGERCAPDQRNVIAFDRILDDCTLRCAVNLGHEHRALNGADLLTGEVIYGNLEEGGLPPFGAIVTQL